VEPTAAMTQTFDMLAAEDVLGRALRQDDLKVVEGIGPKIEEIFHAAGIRTWRQLASTDPKRLKELLDAAGPNFQIHDPSTWPTQGGLLADGKLREFKELTDRLTAGRR
jgi:predicted flap endonuclease-1-like 5' DNA nuclease